VINHGRSIGDAEFLCRSGSVTDVARRRRNWRSKIVATWHDRTTANTCRDADHLAGQRSSISAIVHAAATRLLSIALTTEHEALLKRIQHASR
jgi:hypothetical protein